MGRALYDAAVYAIAGTVMVGAAAITLRRYGADLSALMGGDFASLQPDAAIAGAVDLLSAVAFMVAVAPSLDGVVMRWLQIPTRFAAAALCVVVTMASYASGQHVFGAVWVEPLKAAQQAQAEADNGRATIAELKAEIDGRQAEAAAEDDRIAGARERVATLEAAGRRRIEAQAEAERLRLFIRNAEGVRLFARSSQCTDADRSDSVAHCDAWRAAKAALVGVEAEASADRSAELQTARTAVARLLAAQAAAEGRHARRQERLAELQDAQGGTVALANSEGGAERLQAQIDDAEARANVTALAVAIGGTMGLFFAQAASGVGRTPNRRSTTARQLVSRALGAGEPEAKPRSFAKAPWRELTEEEQEQRLALFTELKAEGLSNRAAAERCGGTHQTLGKLWRESVEAVTTRPPLRAIDGGRA